MNSYHISKFTDGSYDEAVELVTARLKEEGFGILTEIDVKATLKKKIDVDFRRYVILGACNPHLAHKAMTVEDKIGVYLPCNVLVQETAEGKTEVSAMNPMVAMAGVENPALEAVARQVSEALGRVISGM
jgi:uncharacterized protein (DUF302 family)